MKKLYILIILSLACFCYTCEGIAIEEETNEPGPNTELVGKWKLTEQLADPGDGSGKWTKVAENKYIQFNSDLSVEGNGQSDLKKYQVPGNRQCYH